MKDLSEKMQEVRDKTTSLEGKFTVLGIDKFDGDDWVEGTYGTAKEALNIART